MRYQELLGRPWLASVLRQVSVERHWVIDKILPWPGRFIIVAPAKTGKTALALQLAHCVAVGAPFLGYEVPSALRVHYIDYEMGPTLLIDRLNKMAEVYPGADQQLFITSFPQDSGLTYAQVMGLVDDIGLFIIDPAISLGYTDENNNAEVRQKLDELAGMARDRGAAIVVVHHTRKPARESGSVGASLWEARGASAFIDWIDGGLMLAEIDREAGRFRVAWQVRGAEPQENVTLIRDPKTLTYSLISDMVDIRKIYEEVGFGLSQELGRLPKQGEVVLAIQEMLGKSRSWVYGQLRKVGFKTEEE